MPETTQDEDLAMEDERDHWQEYKDDVAMGYIHPDGTGATLIQRTM
jgi:hypothetical protein